MAAGYSVSVTTAASTRTSEGAVRKRFRSATECLEFLGPAAYQPSLTTKGAITQHQHVIIIIIIIGNVLSNRE